MEKKIGILAPSLLSADFGRLAEGVGLIETAGGDWIHVDVMDGHFAENLSFGPKTVSDLRPCTKLPMDVHLMVDNPAAFIRPFASAGADYLTFQIEAAVHTHRIIQSIREAGAKPGICLVPGTPISLAEELLPLVDLVLILMVNPGFGGQKLIPPCLEKISRLSLIRREKNYQYLISVDGGVTEENASGLLSRGADVLIAGSSFFGAKAPGLSCRRLKGQD
ncbi:MAG: ribulose-phosphate 3-epimerase [Spirochaetales bacterium]|jgi:ribulose-phosphate 3-epimerase|nr:ribulose-phosphate 3-epimerase [Spirochaetales bacterium]